MTSAPRQLAASLRMLLVLTVLLGVLYPALIWAVGRVGFADQANGSLVRRQGAVVGSSLLGQQFTDARMFHGRPSVSEYAGDTSGGSNLAAGDRRQEAHVVERDRAFAADNGGAEAPPDALTASASALDPHISPRNALAQVPRVAAANGLTQREVADLVRQSTQGRSLGFLGELRVNVLLLNLAVQARAAGG